MSITNRFPKEDILLTLAPEELGRYVLRLLASLKEGTTLLNSYNFFLPGNLGEFKNPLEVGRAIMEAWVWLEREGLIAPRPGDSGRYIFVTRRGQAAAESEDWDAYLKADQLPRQFLHPVLTIKVWPTFLRGDYDTAVFQAYKCLEVAVRDAIGGPAELIGTDLMRKAFHITDGPLTDNTLPRAEREALSNLFAGAVGSYKNPHSHRNVEIEPQEASEMIILASHLLRIVEQRRTAANA